MRHRLIPVAAFAVVAASNAAAQVSSAPDYEGNGLRAILLTPAGALPQLAPTYDPTTRPIGGLAIRFGRYTLSSTSYSNIGASGWINLGRRVQLGATFGQRTCDDCEGSTMGSVDVAADLYHKEGQSLYDADTDIGLQVSGGFGKAKISDFTARGIVVGLPFTISLPEASHTRLSVFVSPGIARGELASGAATIGAVTRVVVSAGGAISFPAGLGAHVAVHRVITPDSPTQLGFVVSWTFGASRRSASGG